MLKGGYRNKKRKKMVRMRMTMKRREEIQIKYLKIIINKIKK
jgi:hypothetical protein